MNTHRSVLFVPHGSPMFALQPGAAGSAMSDVVGQLPTPRAIVVISPHWETTVPTVGTLVSQCGLTTTMARGVGIVATRSLMATPAAPGCSANMGEP